MNIKWITIMITAALLVGLAGAGTPSRSGTGIDDPRAGRIALAIGYTMSAQHTELMKIRQVKNTPALRALFGTVTDETFYLAGAKVRVFEAGTTPGRIEGLTFHRDALSRAITTRFAAEFREDRGLVLDKIALTPYYTPLPRCALFFVPTRSVPPAAFKGLSFGEALQTANRNAIPPEGGGRPLQDYTVVAFLMDQRHPAERMDLVQSDTAGSEQGRFGIQGHNRSGWCFAALPARFAYDREPETFFNVILTDTTSSRAVASYPNYSLEKRVQLALQKKGFKIGPADGQPNAATRRAIRHFQMRQGLVADGNATPTLLQMLGEPEGMPSAVERVQINLQTLGYDPGPVDGTMGQRTRTAIRQYQIDRRLPADGELRAELVYHIAFAAGTGAPRRPVAGKGSRDEAERYRNKMWPNLKPLP